MKKYVSQADEQIEEMLERLVQNVHTKAESAAQRSTAMVHDAQEIVHNAMQKIKDWNACHFDMLPAWMRLETNELGLKSRQGQLRTTTMFFARVLGFSSLKMQKK